MNNDRSSRTLLVLPPCSREQELGISYKGAAGSSGVNIIASSFSSFPKTRWAMLNICALKVEQPLMCIHELERTSFPSTISFTIIVQADNPYENNYVSCSGFRGSLLTSFLLL
jgi:hypothetical protein